MKLITEQIDDVQYLTETTESGKKNLQHEIIKMSFADVQDPKDANNKEQSYVRQLYLSKKFSRL